MIVKSFKSLWSKLKPSLTNRDLKFFYEVIDIQNSCGRVLICSMRDFNPRYASHWFPTCRCHWNVIFPAYLLNGRKFTGKYSIITNDFHSAIINIETNEIYDPTYYANGSGIDETLEKLSKGYKIENILIHATRVDPDLFKRIVDFSSKKERKIILSILEKTVEEQTAQI